MTRHLMAVGRRPQGWLGPGTDGHDKGTARVEAATGWRIQRAGDLTGKNELLPWFVGVGWQRGREEGLGIGMERFVA